MVADDVFALDNWTQQTTTRSSFSTFHTYMLVHMQLLAILDRWRSSKLPSLITGAAEALTYDTGMEGKLRVCLSFPVQLHTLDAAMLDASSRMNLLSVIFYFTTD